MLKNIKATSFILVLGIFVGAFFLGRLAAQIVPAATTAIQSGADGNWGLSYQEEGKPPVGCKFLQEALSRGFLGGGGNG